MSSQSDADRWVVIDRAISETVECVSRCFENLEKGQAGHDELVSQVQEYLAEEGAHPAEAEHSIESVCPVEAGDVALKRKPPRPLPVWWPKTFRLIDVLRRNGLEKVANEIECEIDAIYSSVTEKSVDELAHYRERRAAEQEATEWLRGYLSARWLLDYVRAKVSEQGNPVGCGGGTLAEPDSQEAGDEDAMPAMPNEPLLSPPKAEDPPKRDADGPIPDDGFRYKGRAYKGLARSPYLLLKAVWLAKDRAVDYKELAKPIYDDVEHFVSEAAVNGWQRTLNSFFRQHALPFHLAASKKTHVAKLTEKREKI